MIIWTPERMKRRPGFAILMDSAPSNRLHVEPEPVAPGLPGSTQSKRLPTSRSARGDELPSKTGFTVDVLHGKCAGIDVHKKTVVTCLRSVDPQGKVHKQVRTFGTMTDNLEKLPPVVAA